jgi:sugar (glycoside-pentoside-hexuronide) transporter
MQKASLFLHKAFGTSPNDGDIQPKEIIGYSIAGFGQNLMCTVIGSYLTVFMTDAIGFSALSVALLMLFARVYDAFNDPIMGSIVDRTRSKWGKCRPYLKWMVIPIALCTIACFLPVYPATKAGFALISTVYVIWGMVYTVADVPYWGLSSALTSDTHKRGILLTVARLACSLGAGIVTIVVPQITAAITAKYTPETVQQPLSMAYFIIAIVFTVLAIPLFYVGFYTTKERMSDSESKAPSLKHNLKLLFKNTPLLLIVLSGVLGSAKMAYSYTGGLYFAKYVLADVEFLGMRGEGLYTLITLALVPGGLAASLAVPWFTKKIGKKATMISSNLIGSAVMFIMYFVGYKSPAALIFSLIGMVIVGIPHGFANIITYAMIADTVEYLEWKTGERAEGICFAMQTFINKIGMAVGAFIGVLAYHMAGVTPNNPGMLDDKGKDTLWAMLVLLGAISLLLTAVPLFFYNFTEKRQQEVVKIIAERKAAEGNGDNA